VPPRFGGKYLVMVGVSTGLESVKKIEEEKRNTKRGMLFVLDPVPYHYK
jgi:hypothetical protein